VDTTEPTEEERIKFYITRTMASLGLVKPADVRGYYTPSYARYKAFSKQLPSLMEEMRGDGEAVRYEVDGARQPYYCLPEDASRLDDLADGLGHESFSKFNGADEVEYKEEKPRIG
jgi:hypothetical protein